MADITVSRNDAASRYEIFSDGALAGFAEFDHKYDAIRFIHTEVDEAFQGQGLAAQLASAALNEVAASGETVIPLCPYIARYLQKNAVEGLNVRWPDAARG